MEKNENSICLKNNPVQISIQDIKYSDNTINFLQNNMNNKENNKIEEEEKILKQLKQIHEVCENENDHDEFNPVKTYQSNISCVNVNTNFNNTTVLNNSLFEKNFTNTNNYINTNDSEMHCQENKIKTIAHSIVSNIKETWSINQTMNFELLNQKEQFKTINKIENSEKDPNHSIKNKIPIVYYDPFYNNLLEFPKMNPGIPYIQNRFINHQYYANQKIIPSHKMKIQDKISSNHTIKTIDLQNKNFQQKLSIVKLESENQALKEKLLELSNNLAFFQNNLEDDKMKLKKGDNENTKEIEDLIRDLKNRIENKENDFIEKEYETKMIDLELQDKSGKLTIEKEKVYSEIQKTEKIINKLTEDNNKYQIYTEKIKNEINFFRYNKIKLENESSMLFGKLDALEKEKILLGKRLIMNDNKIKNLKSDFENQIKELQIYRKQNGAIEDKISELNSNNYNFKMENLELKKKITKIANKIEFLNKELTFIKFEKDQNKNKVHLNLADTMKLNLCETDTFNEEIKE